MRASPPPLPPLQIQHNNEYHNFNNINPQNDGGEFDVISEGNDSSIGAFSDFSVQNLELDDIPNQHRRDQKSSTSDSATSYSTESCPDHTRKRKKNSIKTGNNGTSCKCTEQ